MSSGILNVNLFAFSERERKASQSPLHTSSHSIVSSPHFLLPQCTSFTAEHRDGVSQRGRRGEAGQMKRELNACLTKRDNAGGSVSARKPGRKHAKDRRAERKEGGNRRGRGESDASRAPSVRKLKSSGGK